MKFAHKMIEEIYEESQIIGAFINEGLKEVQEIAAAIWSKQYEMVYVTGSGTSYHAGLAGQYALSKLTQFVTSLIAASELPLWIPSNPTRKSLLIAISQSGESSDVVAAAKASLDKNIDVLAITNAPNSTLMKMAQYTLLTRAGEELAVTATKTYVAQLMALFSLSVEFAAIQRAEVWSAVQLRKRLSMAPRIIGDTMTYVNDQMRRLANKYKHQNFFFILGSGPNYATALEGALKLKEACNIFAEGFASREFLHGPIQLVDKRTSVFFILTEDQLKGSLSEIKRMRSFGASVLSISEKMDKSLKEASTEVIRVEADFPKVFSPMLFIVPLQLFAYYSSVARGLNPDRPEKLTKVVKRGYED